MFLLGGMGCDTPYLEGSLGQLLDLTYTEARVQLSPEDVAVFFTKNRASDALADGGVAATNFDIQFQVSMALWDAGVEPGVKMDLTVQDASGTQRGQFTRQVLNDPRTSFPKAERAELFFDRVPVVGQPVSGNFHVTFENGVETASGRTVFGSFDVKGVK